MDQLGGFVSTPPRSATLADSEATASATEGPGPQVPADHAEGTVAANRGPSSGGRDGAAPARGLDEEVAGLVGGFTSFWGRVKKQSVAALHEAEKQYETARADLSPLLNQARTQLDQLSEQTRAEIQRLSEAPAPTSGSDVIIGPDGIPIVLDEVPATAPPASAPATEKGKGVERGEGGEGGGASDEARASTEASSGDAEGSATQQTPAAAASAFFSKWQAQLASNPNVKDLSRNISSLQSNLSTNLHQIQNQLTHLDLTEGQKVADRYLHKGEAWFQEFSAEVAHLAKEAVKVVPPTGNDAADSTRRSGFERTGTPVMTRRDMVMHKLRTDTSLLLVDPAQPPAVSAPAPTDLSASTSAAPNPDTREGYAAFLAAVQERGGLDGDAFRADVERELLDGGEVLVQTRDQLVPAQIPEEVFWARYFFRKQCVEEEQERRKKVLQVAQQEEDDFSWDMDDEESVASPRVPQEPTVAALAVPAPSTDAGPASAASSSEATPTPPPLPTVPKEASASSTTTPRQAGPVATAGTAAGPTSAAQVRAVSTDTSPTTSSESPRASSDGTSSFDIVGETSGHPSADEHERGIRPTTTAAAAAATAQNSKPAAGSTVGTTEKAPAASQEPGQEEDEDSDWE
ncbi:hypothetical protein JCM3774_000052 [Rhodotorula dairenensis]